MTDFVSDCSIAISWVVAAQATDATEELLQAAREGARVYVPALWPFEIANALLVLVRRKRLTGEQYRAALETLGRLVRTVDLEGTARAMDITPQLAAHEQLTVYDAAYLELSLRLKLPLATRDSSLAEAARRRKVKVLGYSS